MTVHRSNILWTLCPQGRYPQAYISAIDKKNIQIEFCYEQAMSGDVIKLTRRRAKLLARRILQCLDEIKKIRR